MSGREATVAKFERYAMRLGSTWAYRRFRAHQTEINNLYWSFVPVAGFADYLARHSKVGTDTAVLFHASGPDVRHLAPKADEWRKHFREFQNWVRLAALLSAASYLEVFIRGAVTIALQSDPLVRFGRPRLMDGVTWLKHGMRDDVETLVSPCVVGEWGRRAARYGELFGRVPAPISNNIGELDQMRMLRNSVGHAFGRNVRQSDSDLRRVRVGAPERLTEARFKRWLGLVDGIAVAIDGHLGSEHIGEFESITYYHHWRTQPRQGRERGYAEPRAFSRELARVTGQPCGQTFSKGLIDHYSRV